jgi:hypothetical protein
MKVREGQKILQANRDKMMKLMDSIPTTPKTMMPEALQKPGAMKIRITIMKAQEPAKMR